MSDSPGSPTPAGPPVHERVRLAALAILVVGVIAALLVYVLSPDEGTDVTAIAGGKLYRHNLAVIGGHAAVNAARFNDWFASLWHGRPLAVVIALVTLVIAGFAFWIAHLMAIPPLPLQSAGSEADDDAILKRRDQPGVGHGRDAGNAVR